jgi:hypothetical protein
MRFIVWLCIGPPDERCGSHAGSGGRCAGGRPPAERATGLTPVYRGTTTVVPQAEWADDAYPVDRGLELMHELGRGSSVPAADA